MEDRPKVEFDPKVAAAVRAGLTSQPKWLPAWLFYDEAGSRLFEAITKLPEYYPTRTEQAILTLKAKEIVAAASYNQNLTVIEFGSGTADKIFPILREAVARQGVVRYEPIDVSASALEQARLRIGQELPQVEVAPRVLDYTEGVEFSPLPPGSRRLVLYIGSSLGNFDPLEAARLLVSIRAALMPGDCLLLGLDRVKAESVLTAAYNDDAGVTAAFNRNLLLRMNRELGAGFAPEQFAHRAFWNPEPSRIEMHLASRIRQRVSIAALALEIEFEAGETIHTENSYKYRPGEGAELLRSAGFVPADRWSDPREWFELCLGRAG